MDTKLLSYCGVVARVVAGESSFIGDILRYEVISENDINGVELVSSVVVTFLKANLNYVVPERTKAGSKDIVAHPLDGIGVSCVAS